jgi:hypothetical protein
VAVPVSPNVRPYQRRSVRRKKNANICEIREKALDKDKRIRVHSENLPPVRVRGVQREAVVAASAIFGNIGKGRESGRLRFAVQGRFRKPEGLREPSRGVLRKRYAEAERILEGTLVREKDQDLKW